MEKKKYAAYGMLLAGTALLAVGVQNFLEPMELVAGGISGLGMILDDLSRRLGGPAVPLWLVNTALNVPLFLLAWYAQGRQFLGKTILTSLLFSVMLYIAARFPMYHGDLLTAAAYGGVLMGTGLGLVLRGGATTGGVDLAAALLHDGFFHHVSVARLVLFLDGSIILLGLVTFGPTHTLYAILAVGIMEKVMDRVAEGGSAVRAAVIVTEEGKAMAEGLSALRGRGVMSLLDMENCPEKGQNVLYCVFSQKDLSLVKSLIMNIDRKAYFLLSDMRDVLGDTEFHK